MEFLRFGSSIPGSYWGCCAFDIIQDFSQDPDDPYSISLVDGDQGTPILTYNDELAFIGKTYHEVFLQRLRIGTFSDEPVPNHGFLCVLTDEQLCRITGKKWLSILKENGFEFIRTVDNSVYSGSSFDEDPEYVESHPNHLFGLFRNIADGRVLDQFTPPKAWVDLPSVIPEPRQRSRASNKKYTERISEVQRNLWEELPCQETYCEKDLESMGVPIHYAGKRSKFPQQSKTLRLRAQGAKTDAASIPAPWATVTEDSTL